MTPTATTNQAGMEPGTVKQRMKPSPWPCGCEVQLVTTQAYARSQQTSPISGLENAGGHRVNGG